LNQPRQMRNRKRFKKGVVRCQCQIIRKFIVSDSVLTC
jgi:hypothetical protein